MTFNITRVGTINYFLNVQFYSNNGYEFYIERGIMTSLYINYIKSNVKGKGDIAKMVMKRKAELVKNLNYQGLKTHGCKITKIRS